MSLYQEWKADIESHSKTPEEQNIYWQEFCEAEQGVYKKVLGEKRQVVEGTLGELAKEFDMDKMWFMGFMDGISESLNTPLGDLEEYTEESPVKIDIDFEKLYTNMLKVPAEWLYTLEEWDPILTEERRAELLKDYKNSKTVHVHKIGRNDPCPCGSGKKYKKCCGKHA